MTYPNKIGQHIMEATTTYHYQVPFDTTYDYLGESVRNDLEDLLLEDALLFTVDITVRFECGKVLTLHLDVPESTGYDYVGESLRDFIEDVFVDNESNMNVTLTLSKVLKGG